MANEVKKAVSKAGRTLGRQDNLTKALIKAGSNIEKRKSAIKDVSSYKDYLNLDPGTVSKLKTSELRTVVARLNKVESKRLKILEKYGYKLDLKDMNFDAIIPAVDSGKCNFGCSGMSITDENYSAVRICFD